MSGGEVVFTIMALIVGLALGGALWAFVDRLNR